MRARTWATIAVSLTMLAPVGCGGDSGGTGSVPTAADLGAALLVPGDLAGTWTVNPGADDAPMPDTGIVTDEARPMLPTIEFCDAASDESRAAASDVRWLAFRQLDLTPVDPIVLPGDRTGHLVFVQEFLLSAGSTTTRAMFELLRDGMAACLGDIAAGEEGPGVASAMPVTVVGDDRYGVLTTLQEAGGGAEWLLHDTLVLDGAVLMMVDVVDIRMGVAPLFTAADVDAIVAAAARRL